MNRRLPTTDSDLAAINRAHKGAEGQGTWHANAAFGVLFHACLAQRTHEASLAGGQAHELYQVTDDKRRGVVDGVFIPFRVAGTGVKDDLHLVTELGLEEQGGMDTKASIFT
jgi:hypothetical protein